MREEWVEVRPPSWRRWAVLASIGLWLYAVSTLVSLTSVGPLPDVEPPKPVPLDHASVFTDNASVFTDLTAGSITIGNTTANGTLTASTLVLGTTSTEHLIINSSGISFRVPSKPYTVDQCRQRQSTAPADYIEYCMEHSPNDYPACSMMPAPGFAGYFEVLDCSWHAGKNPRDAHAFRQRGNR